MTDITKPGVFVGSAWIDLSSAAPLSVGRYVIDVESRVGQFSVVRWAITDDMNTAPVVEGHPWQGNEITGFHHTRLYDSKSTEVLWMRCVSGSVLVTFSLL